MTGVRSVIDTKTSQPERLTGVATGIRRISKQRKGMAAPAFFLFPSFGPGQQPRYCPQSRQFISPPLISSGNAFTDTPQVMLSLML